MRKHLLSIFVVLLTVSLAFAGGNYLIQSSFNSGELTPRLSGRSDLSKYQSGLETCLNATVLPHGGAERRPGFEYIAEVKTSSKATRLIPFEFSTTQTYIIEAGDQYFRFYKDGGQILSGASAYEIETPYRDEDVGTLKFTQSADTLYIAHPNYSPRKLTRTAHTSWSLSIISFTDRPADWGIEAFTMTGATQANPVVITKVAHGLASSDQVIISGVVGMTELNGTLYNITVINADTFSLQNEDDDDIDGSGYTAYASGGIVDVVGQPAAVTLFEERSAWAGVPAYPQSVYLSTAGDFEVMTTGANDDDGLEYTLASDQVNAIRWLVSQNKLFMGTNGAEWTVSGSGTNAPVTPSSISVKRETSFGSENIQPLSIGNSVIFVQRPGRNLRRWGYNFESDAYKGDNLNVYSEHLTKNYSITDVAYQQSPYQTIWAIRSDGALLSLTYMPDHDVYGWARHNTGASGEFESIAVIRGSAFDELWAIVNRTVDGSTVRYIEQLQTNEWAYHYLNTAVTQPAVQAMEGNANTSLLIHSNTTDGSTTFTDSSNNGHTITPGGDAHHDTNFGSYTARFGTSFIFFDGAGDWLTVPNHSSLLFGSSDFTIDFWIKAGDGAGNTGIMGVWDSGVGKSWWVSRTHATDTFNFSYSTDGSAETTVYGTVAHRQGTPYSIWTHVRIVRQGSILRSFINGVKDIDTSISGTLYASTNDFQIGTYDGIGGLLDSLLDEILIVKGEALSVSAFVPPNQAYGPTGVSLASTTTEETTPENAFFVDSGLIYNDSATITDATNDLPITITATAHGFSNGDTVYISGIVGMTELNGNTYKVANKTANTFELNDSDDAEINGLSWSAYTSGGTAEKYTTTITGLDHLEGETVSVIADGAVQDDETVVGGSITIDTASAKVIVGLPYTTDLKTLRPDMGQKETLQGRNKKIISVILRLYETFSCQVGPDEDNLDTLSFDNSTYTRGTMPGIYTGDKKIRPQTTYNPEGQILVRQSEPAPLTLLAIIKEIEVY